MGGCSSEAPRDGSLREVTYARAMRTAWVCLLVACSGAKTAAPVGNARPLTPVVTPDPESDGKNLIPLAGGYTLRIGFGDTHASSATTEAELATARIDVIRDADQRVIWKRVGFDAIADEAITEAYFASCNEYRALGGAFLWGETSGVRISLSCANGEDSFRAQELAVLLEITDAKTEPYPPLWVGQADVHTTDYAEGAACLTWELHTFEVKGATLVRTISSEERAPEGETGCVEAQSTRIERVPIRRRN